MACLPAIRHPVEQSQEWVAAAEVVDSPWAVHVRARFQDVDDERFGVCRNGEDAQLGAAQRRQLFQRAKKINQGGGKDQNTCPVQRIFYPAVHEILGKPVVVPGKYPLVPVEVEVGEHKVEVSVLPDERDQHGSAEQDCSRGGEQCGGRVAFAGAGDMAGK